MDNGRRFQATSSDERVHIQTHHQEEANDATQEHMAVFYPTLTVVSNDGVDLGSHVLRVPPVSWLVVRKRSLGHVRQADSLRPIATAIETTGKNGEILMPPKSKETERTGCIYEVSLS